MSSAMLLRIPVAKARPASDYDVGFPRIARRGLIN